MGCVAPSADPPWGPTRAGGAPPGPRRYRPERAEGAGPVDRGDEGVGVLWFCLKLRHKPATKDIEKIEETWWHTYHIYIILRWFMVKWRRTLTFYILVEASLFCKANWTFDWLGCSFLRGPPRKAQRTSYLSLVFCRGLLNSLVVAHESFLQHKNWVQTNRINMVPSVVPMMFVHLHAKCFAVSFGFSKVGQDGCQEGPVIPLGP